MEPRLMSIKISQDRAATIGRIYVRSTAMWPNTRLPITKRRSANWCALVEIESRFVMTAVAHIVWYIGAEALLTSSQVNSCFAGRTQ